MRARINGLLMSSVCNNMEAYVENRNKDYFIFYVDKAVLHQLDRK